MPALEPVSQLSAEDFAVLRDALGPARHAEPAHAAAMREAARCTARAAARIRSLTESMETFDPSARRGADMGADLPVAADRG